MMKKATHKLVIHRESIRDLQALDAHALRYVRGGANTNLVPETNRECTALAVASGHDCSA
jgi:hypothetical protein